MKFLRCLICPVYLILGLAFEFSTYSIAIQNEVFSIINAVLILAYLFTGILHLPDFATWLDNKISKGRIAWKRKKN